MSTLPGCSTTAGTTLTSAHADVGVAAQGPNIKDPGPDFGFIPNAIGIVAPGRLYVESSVEHNHNEGDLRIYSKRVE